MSPITPNSIETRNFSSLHNASCRNFNESMVEQTSDSDDEIAASEAVSNSAGTVAAKRVRMQRR